MYDFFMSWFDKDVKSKTGLLEENNKLDGLMLDSSTKTVKYVNDLSNYVINENVICKVAVLLTYSDTKSERRTYEGKYYEDVYSGKYYVKSDINLRPSVEVGKMTYKLEIFMDDKLYHNDVLAFKYRMNDSIENTLETISLSKREGNELIISVIRENNKYIMDNLKYISTIKK